MSQELLICNFTDSANTNYWEYNTDGLYMKTKGSAVWLYTPYIELPPATTYEYDFIVSIEANNQVYIQIERFNASKGSISNNAATNCIGGVKPSSTLLYTRYKGTIALATFGSGDSIQNTKYIRVRIGNNYNNTSGYFKIHTWSLRAINNDITSQQVKKTGQLITDHFRESYDNAAFSKNGFVDGGQFYEY